MLYCPSASMRMTCFVLLPSLGRPLACALVLLWHSMAGAVEQPLPRSEPERQGVDSSALLAFVEALDAIDSVHSVMVLRHGQVVAEGWWAPYAAGELHVLYSLTKSFTSTAVGLAAQEGLLHVNDTVISHFPKEAPKNPSENLAKMRIRDLLRMATGHQDDQMQHLRESEGSWVRAFLAAPVEHRPGTHFKYDSAASYMLAAIVQKVSGQTVEQYLRPRLFDPLAVGEVRWGQSPEGVNLGAGGMMLDTESIAKFGQLYLQRGAWAGRRLLRSSWVEAATSLQIATGSDPDSNWDAGYGYQFWRNKVTGYRGDGAFGQFSMVLPYFDMVIAMTSGTSDMAAVMDAVWDHLVGGISMQGPLPEAPRARARLTSQLASLSLPPQEGAAEPTAALPLRIALEPNDQGLKSLSLEAKGSALQLTFEDGDGAHPIQCGYGRWVRGQTSFQKRISNLMDRAPQGIAASCGWSAPGLLAAKLCFNETPYTISYRVALDKSRARVETEHNLRWGETKRKPIGGKVVVQNAP